MSGARIHELWEFVEKVGGYRQRNDAMVSLWVLIKGDLPKMGAIRALPGWLLMPRSWVP